MEDSKPLTIVPFLDVSFQQHFRYIMCQFIWSLLGCQMSILEKIVKAIKFSIGIKNGTRKYKKVRRLYLIRDKTKTIFGGVKQKT